MSFRPAAFLLLAAVAATAASSAQTGPLFPEPFRVEHHLIQEDGAGGRFAGEPVVDTYGGSWIVSERKDGSRRIVDFARREVTEVDPAHGTYWTVGFGQLGELTAQAARGQGLLPEADETAEKAEDGATVPVEVRELPATRAGAAGGEPWTRAGVRRFEVAAGDRADEKVELWVDPTVRLGASARAAIGGFEAELRRGSGARRAGVAGKLAAATAAEVDGFPVRRVEAFAVDPAGERVGGRSEDVATRLERLESFPLALATIPEGLVRIPHPLEVTVRFLGEEEERRRIMSGTGSER